MSAHHCPDCGVRMRVKDNNEGGDTTFRKLACPCGSRFESEERIVRRLPSATGIRLPVGEKPPPATESSPPAEVSQRGVGGGLAEVRSGGSDPNPGVLDPPERGRARRKRRATQIEYPPEFDAEWNQTAKTGAKEKAYEAWVREGKPDFGASWKRWEASPVWRQEWYHYPHVSSWLNDGRYKQDPSETRVKSASSRPAPAPDNRAVDATNRRLAEQRAFQRPVNEQELGKIHALVTGLAEQKAVG